MTQTTQNLLSLRWSLGLLAISAIIGGGMVMLARDLVRQAEGERDRLAARKHDFRVRLDNIRNEERDLRERTTRYQQIVGSGLVAQEERLEWVERIKRIKAARRLLEMDYELSPQHVIDDDALPGGSSAGPYQYMASTMRLKMALLHEDDLLGFLADLRGGVRAYLLVRDCRIERAPALPEPAGQGLAPRLRAECTIDWVTLREKKP